MAKKKNSRAVNGTGSFYKRADGRWCYQITEIVENKRVRKTFYGKTQQEAKQKYARYQQKKKGNSQIQGQVGVGEWKLYDFMNHWLENYKRQEVKITTYENYVHIIRAHIGTHNLGAMKLNAITEEDLRTFVEDMKTNGKKGGGGLSDRMVKYIMTQVNAALNMAVQLEKINVNPCRYYKISKGESKDFTPLTKEEVREFYEYCRGDRLQALYELELNSGMRKGELLGLSWDNVKFDQGCILVRDNLIRVSSKDEDGRTRSTLQRSTPKTKKSRRTIFVIPEVMESLRSHKQRQDKEKREYETIYQDKNAVFCKEDGDFISPEALLEDFQKKCENLGFRRYRFHDLSYQNLYKIQTFISSP